MKNRRLIESLLWCYAECLKGKKVALATEAGIIKFEMEKLSNLRGIHCSGIFLDENKKEITPLKERKTN